MRKLFLLSGWFSVAPLTLLYAFYLYLQISPIKAFGPLLFSSAKGLVGESPYAMFSSLPKAMVDIKTAVELGDARPIIVENFLKKYNSPLAPYANLIVEVSDKYNFPTFRGTPDFRYLPAIAMAESGAGKNMPEDCHNAWGYGIYGDQVMCFSSWEEAIDRVARSLKEDYFDLGLSLEEIGAKYAPPSVKKGGSWAKAVASLMAEM